MMMLYFKSEVFCSSVCSEDARAVDRRNRDGAWMTAHHRSVDVPEGSLLAVQDLPLDFILSPVVPADEIRHCEKRQLLCMLHQLDA